MKTIDEANLESDIQYRFNYIADFIGFDSDDAALIQSFAPFLGPCISEIVDKTYEKLLSNDATARHFIPKQRGFDGKPPKELASVTHDHLTRYFMQLIGRNYDAKMVMYLDTVGKIHTPKAGSKEIDVPLVQMNALMGFLSNTLMQVIEQSPLAPQATYRMQRAFNKLLWIQNDFITRHYCNTSR